MLPVELFEKNLSHPEFRLMVSLIHLGSDTRLVDATMGELEVLTSMKAESLRRALRGLEEHGLVKTIRTKRDFGKFHKNKYQLVLPSLENEVNGKNPSLENEGSTHGQVVPLSSNSKVGTTGKPVSNTRSTTYFLVSAAGAHKGEDMVMWKDTSGDDSIGGFGLFEEEMVGGQPKPKADKRKASTRGQRPESEWTANDVAAEFSHQLGLRFPYTPGLVNVNALRGALLKDRAKYGTTPEVEMELMRMFFEDESNLKDADAQAAKIHGRYLKMFRTSLNKAYERLGLEANLRVLGSELAPEVEEEYLVASDGRRFDNSIVGRKMMARYEQRLKERV